MLEGPVDETPPDMDDHPARSVCPYRIEKALEGRYDRPLEEIKAEIGWAQDHDLARFHELMEEIDLDTVAYWESDWSHFELRGYEWAKPS